jgi:serine/threonine protein kinase
MARVLTKAGRYQIVSELGRGSMGVVYRGFDPVIGRTVAIKTMLIEGLTGTEFQEYKARFQREAQAAGILAHPNIVTVYDFGEDEGVLYLAMEFLEGKSLQDLVEKQNILPVETIIPMFEQVCSALDHAHLHSIVHRDIKPANIMILDSGLVKVTDFGIAKIMSMGMTQAGQILGTPNYMSPEQVKGRAVDGRSDIFSLGVILYELVTGEKPFGGQNITTVIYKIINENPIPPRELDSTIHPGLSFVISKALTKVPEERFQTCRELSESLKNYKNLGGEPAPTATVVIKVPPIQAPPAQPPQASARPAAPQARYPSAEPRPVPPSAPVRPRPSRPVPPPSFAAVKAESKGTSPVVWILLGLLLFGGIGAGGYYFLFLKNPASGQQARPETTAPPATAPVTQPAAPAPAETAAGTEQTQTGAAQPAAGTATGATQPGAATQPANAPETPAAKPAAKTEAERPAEAAAKVAPALKYGKIFISSSPQGAQITVDNRSDPDWVTPHTVEGLAAGSHAVILSKEGYSSAHRSVAVEAGRTAALNVQLALFHAPAPSPQAVNPPAPETPPPATDTTGIVLIKTQPPLPDVEVLIDGRSYGFCPVNAKLDAGDHTYTLKRSGTEVLTGKFKIKPGVITTLPFKFAE